MKNNPFDTPEFKENWAKMVQHMEDDFDPNSYIPKYRTFDKMYEKEKELVLEYIKTPAFIEANVLNKPMEEIIFEFRGFKLMGIAK